MHEYQLAELDHEHSGEPGAILAALQGVESVLREHDVAIHCNDDQTELAETTLAGHGVSLRREVVWFVALRTQLPPSTPIGRHGLPAGPSRATQRA